MILIKIAWRNIWRSKKRSYIIIIAIILGLWAGMFLIGFYNGMIEQRVRTAISQEISHIQMHHPEFSVDYNPKFFIAEGPEILKQTNTNPNVKAATGRIKLTGMISSASGSSGILINGVQPKSEQLVTGLQNKLIKGNYFDSVKSNQIIISERLLKKLKLNPGSKIILTFQDCEENLSASAFKITGIYKTGNGPYDDKNVYVSIQDLDSLIHLKGQLNEIAIVLHSNTLLEKTQFELQKKYPQILTQNWTQISPELGLTVSISDQMAFIYMGIILLALAFGIINTMMMSVLERTKELGMLMALGMNKLKVFSMIIMETTFLVSVGSPIGITFGLVTILISNKKGINLNAYKEVYENFGYSDTIYPELALKQFLIIIILVIVTAMISGLFPAQRALKLKPIESIRK